jgi:hypothetical protein
MASLNDTKKTNLSKRGYLQSQTNNPCVKLHNFQTSLLSLPPAPQLQFQRQPKKLEISKDLAKHKAVNKRSLDNAQENIGKQIETIRMPSPLLNSEKIIDNYRHSTKSIRDLSYDHLKLQKDYMNAFQPRWIEHMKTNVDNYLSFQEKMIMLYNQMCKDYLQNIYEIKTNKEKEKI